MFGGYPNSSYLCVTKQKTMANQDRPGLQRRLHPRSGVTLDINELIEILKKMQNKGCKSVGVEGTLYVVEDGCHTIIASTEPQW